MLILAGISITVLWGENGILKSASDAKLQTEIAQARDKLEVALSGAKIEKQTNSQYNENEYLDEYILNQIKEAEIIDNIAIVDNHTFTLDRSVPKIGEYIGKKEELTFPDLEISKPIVSEDDKAASFTITTKEKQRIRWG